MNAYSDLTGDHGAFHSESDWSFQGRPVVAAAAAVVVVEGNGYRFGLELVRKVAESYLVAAKDFENAGRAAQEEQSLAPERGRSHVESYC